jgi:hypothetical protein
MFVNSTYISISCFISSVMLGLFFFCHITSTHLFKNNCVVANQDQMFLLNKPVIVSCSAFYFYSQENKTRCINIITIWKFSLSENIRREFQTKLSIANMTEHRRKSLIYLNCVFFNLTYHPT